MSYKFTTMIKTDTAECFHYEERSRCMRSVNGKRFNMPFLGIRLTTNGRFCEIKG